MNMHKIGQASLAFLISFVCFFAQAAFGVTPPGFDAPRVRQTPPYPPPDPSIYKHRTVTKLNYGGTGKNSFWLFEPDNPKPKKAPLLVFIPGWTSTNPVNLGAWFDHLVKQGNIVAYLQYQDSALTPLSETPQNALENFRKALAELQHGQRPDGSAHVRPDLNRFSVFGQSGGGILIADVAAMAASAGLPQPQVIFPVTPGRTDLLWRSQRIPLYPLADLSTLPHDALMVVVAADHDNFFGARTRDSVRLLTEATGIPPQNGYLYFTQSIPGSSRDTGQRAGHAYAAGSDLAYDSGEPPGLNLIPGLPRLSVLLETITHGADELSTVVNNLDYEIWRLFDETRAVRFDGAKWTMPVIPFTDIHPSPLDSVDNPAYLELFGIDMDDVEDLFPSFLVD
jgi:hypothetical protein